MSSQLSSQKKFLNQKNFSLYISSQEILDKIQSLASLINHDYADKKPVLLVILNGAFRFSADLVRYIDIDVEIQFLRLASYKGTESTGEIKKILGLTTHLADRHVLILEDIVDTGLTAHQIWQDLQAQKPASLALMTLLLKPDALSIPVECAYVGFSIPNQFVVGYGLDFDQQGREWNDIYVAEEASQPPKGE